MNQIILIVAIEVADMTRAKNIKEAVETQVAGLPETEKTVETRYKETP